MFRPVRRARQRPIQDEVVGILPEEEAALRRALYASLQDEKKSPEKHEDRNKKGTTSLDEFTTFGSLSHQPSSSGFDNDSWISPIKKIRLESLSDCSSPFPSSPGGLGQLSGYSSPIGSPGSIGSSLKLVLSTSSYSSSSNWSSSEASSPDHTETGLEAAFSKKKRKGGNIASISRKQKGKGKGKGKLSIDSFLFGASPSKEKTPPKGKYSPKISVSTLKSNKSPKLLKTPPKLSKSPKKPQSGKKGTPYSKVRHHDYSGNRSKQLQALVLHDHCYFNHEANDSKPQERVNTGAKGVDNSPTSPCTFQAQRKFAQNPAPLQSQRPSAEEAEKIHKLKEVPKTEDFITFLCLRGSNHIPENFRKFGRPWTPRTKRVTGKNGQRLRLGRTLPGGNGKGTRMKSAKKLDFTARGSCGNELHLYTAQLTIQALNGSYHLPAAKSALPSDDQPPGSVPSSRYISTSVPVASLILCSTELCL